MTASVLDVNEAFRAEQTARVTAAHDARNSAIAANARRAADFDKRVASGELRPLGGNRFEVTSGHDKGEVWTLRKTAIGDLILPETHLDESKGRVALYSAVPVWHGAGTVIPGGITDIDEVLKLGGLDFEVGIRPAMFYPEAGENGEEPALQTAEDLFITYRKDTNKALGSVGSIYTPFQNRPAFEFLQDLVTKWDVTWESAGALFGGKRVFISMRLPREIRIDPEGINDEIVPFVIFLNSHDGSTKVITCISPWRPVCANTERFALRDAKARWGHTHTRRVGEKVQEARAELGLSMAYYDKWIAEETMLAQTGMSTDDFIASVKDVFEPPKRDAGPGEKQNYARRCADLVLRWEDNADRLGRNGYAAERAITEHLDHLALKPRGDLRGKFSAALATRVLEGDQDPAKSKAHKRLMTLVRR